MPLTVLATADCHLGRSSAPLVGGIEPEFLRTRHAWSRLVELAIAHPADLLLIGGDLIDAANRRWEVTGPLLRDLRRLREAGVLTAAVAGNHDWDTLPRLADELAHDAGPGLALLGRGGAWERRVIERRGERVALEGWSFPREHVREDPFAGDAPAPEPGIPTIGLVHGELDVATSAYAPLRRRAMEARAAHAWIVGHVHAPALGSIGRGVLLSPGSPQAMDFGEPGAHGAWRFTIDGGVLATPDFIPLSSMRYEWLEIDLGGAGDGASVEARLLESVQELGSRCALESGPVLSGLAVRVRLRGRTAAHAEVPALAAAMAQWTGDQAFEVRIVSVTDETLPPIDLDRLADGTAATPPATAARLLRGLEAGTTDDDVERLLDSLRARLALVDRQSDYAGLDVGGDESAPAAPDLRDIARATLRRILGAVVGGAGV